MYIYIMYGGIDLCFQVGADHVKVNQCSPDGKSLLFHSHTCNGLFDRMPN